MKKFIALLLAAVILLGAGYLYLNLSFAGNREEVLACIEAGDFDGAQAAMGNVMFFRYKDEQLCVTVSTAIAFLNADYGDASYKIIARSAGEGYAPAQTVLQHLQPIAYDRALSAFGDADNRHVAEDLFAGLGDYKDSADYAFVCQVWSETQYSDFLGEEGVERLVTLMHIPTVPDLLVYSNHTAIDYLAGIWTAENSTKGFVMEADGNASYDLPFVDAEGSYYRIIEGVFTLLDNNDAPVGELFRFTPVDGEHMTVYCYADGQNYSMRKLLDN